MCGDQNTLERMSFTIIRAAFHLIRVNVLAHPNSCFLSFWHFIYHRFSLPRDINLIIFGHTILTSTERYYRSSLGQDLTIEPISYVYRRGGVCGLIWIRCSYFVELLEARGAELNNNMLYTCLFPQSLNSLRAKTVLFQFSSIM